MDAWLAMHSSDGTDNSNPFRQQLREAVADYALETGGGELPTAHFRDWLAEWGREARRRQSGLLLLTAHRAKGLEFDHVAVLDGDWEFNATTEDRDAIRRLYYVAMTRARKTLLLARLDTIRPSLLDSLADGPHLLRRQPVQLAPPPPELSKHYAHPSLKEINIGHAGRRDPGHPIHAALARLQPGAPLALQLLEGAWHMIDSHGQIVGKMARDFAPPAESKAIPARVRCILRWDKDHTDAKYGVPRCEQWEIPLPELILGE